MGDARRPVPTSEIEARIRAREERSESVGRVLEAALPGASPKLARTMGTMRAWLSVNGDLERAHTTGIYVENPRSAGEDPALVVYVDTKACEVDFRANAEVYLARLAAAGMSFSRVTFRQDRRRRPKSAPLPAKRRAAAPELPALSPEEEAEVAALVADLPEPLRKSASQAMRMSLRWDKQKSS